MDLSRHGTAAKRIGEAAVREREQRFKDALDYCVKLLLYLNHDSTQVTEWDEYSRAPKQFPGLGKRKRDLKLTQVEQLYDRYIVGPACLAEAGGERTSDNGSGSEVSAHWRRGHFRLQRMGRRHRCAR